MNHKTNIGKSLASVAARCPSRTVAVFGVLAVGVPVLAIASPVTVPHRFSDGDVISAEAFNENFDDVADAINDNATRLTAAEAARPSVTIRKSTGALVAMAFCESDEVLTGGGCFLPPENLYDPDFEDYDTFYTGAYPRPMVGLTSVPVAAGTEAADIRPLSATGNRIIPFAGDPIAEDEGSVPAEPGGGWACRPGIVEHNDSASAQAITTNFYESWWFRVKAYAVCMSI